jgi:penicillin G amidase
MFRGLGRRLPVIDGTLEHEGLRASVTIRRDGHGVPYINAGNDHDAWFALGFCQGQDRSFQLETIVRSVRGTLSEAIGTRGLSVDRLSRRVGFKRAAEEHLGHLDDDIREMLVAFAAGINAGREIGVKRNAHEFSLLRISPTAWTASDAIGYLKFTSLVMSTNWAEELARYQILIRDGIESLDVLEPGSRANLSVTNPPGTRAAESTISLIDEARSVIRELGLEADGSNNWVVSGARTKNGNPILANDTHLSPVLPTQFYLAHLEAPGWAVSGGAFTGSPGFFLGHNGYAAWGITIGFLDNTDLFVEDIGPDGTSVREGDEYVPCDVRNEQITVKGGDDLNERVLVTRRGPIVGPALDGRPMSLSMSATWLQKHRFRSMLTAHQWRSYEQFQEETNHHPNVSLNVVYADADGNIGWKLAGNIPQRNGTGAVPLPASDPANHWKDELREPDERLTLLNPECGYIATANNRPVSDPEAAGFGVDWLEGFRISRICEVLDSRDDWSTGDMCVLQQDVESIPWRDLKPVIQSTEPVDDDSRAAKAMLLRWDGQVSAGSASAALFETFLASLTEKIVDRAAPVSYTWALGKGGTSGLAGNYFGSVRVGQVIKLATEKPSGWFHGGWNPIIANSMGDGLRKLRLTFGQRTRHWSWGAIRPLRLTNPSGRGPLAGVFNRGPFRIGGDTNTVHAAGVVALDPLSAPRSTATARTVIEIGDWDNARFVLLGGQSGNPLSPNYDDQVPIWLDGEGIPVPFSAEAIEAVTEVTLTLLPAGLD